MTNNAIITEILKWEGGFVDDPDDRGRATNMGITQSTLSEWVGFAVTKEDVRKLSEKTAREIYLKKYIEEPGFNGINAGPLRHLVVDCGVHHSPRRAAKWLQEIADVAVDGIVGPITLRTVNSMSMWKRQVYTPLLKLRLLYYAQIVRNDPTQAKFLVGWMRRATSFIV